MNEFTGFGLRKLRGLPSGRDFFRLLSKIKTYGGPGRGRKTAGYPRLQELNLIEHFAM